ncbi:MAG: hypothetical protein AAB453_04260 [Patescibacteria group bacterium]
MNQEQAKQRMKSFIGDNKNFTFTIKYFPGNKWVAQCNEIDGIITCGEVFDVEKMESSMEDAILTAAGIPAKFADGLLKKVWIGNTVAELKINDDKESDYKLFQSTYQLNQYAGVR